ncbi:uncharacterized protein LOC116342206 [Contarinia nasturtii]|uniref:uncharacterized protein LOC116342206 n=1 Tax=Contarinia nasturtii TaxID=265458 RepID=UPI0012D39EDF|nr:uncharacterized protein LOC116342206 [Contarinia nasturtii]
MSSKQQQQTKAPTTDKNVVETADATIDDDNKSDSEYEYEYEEIEVEVDDDYEEETGSKVMISEVETIVPKEEKKPQETLVLKSDGTTQKLIQKSKISRTSVSQDKQVKTIVNQERQMKQEKKTKVEKVEKMDMVNDAEKQELSDKPRLGRALTSQEESILLPLLQGLLAANGNDSPKAKPENSSSQNKEPSTSNKNSRSNSLVKKNENSELAEGSNILVELSTALNRLQNTLLEEKEVVTDTRKRNTILTLVAWLKRVLQTSTTDNTEAQLFSLSEMLPTELLLSKLMPQLTNGNDNEKDGPQQDNRSPSSKRFSRQKNNRFNTVGVSKEELADARLYLQKKLLSENLATSASKVVHEKEQQAILDDDDDSRRKSLNLTYSNDLDKDIRSIFRESKNSFSKSIDLVPSPDDVNLKHVFPVTRIEQTKTSPSAPTTTSATRIEQTKSVFRRKSNPNLNNATTDSDDDEPNNRKSNGSITNSTKSMNKFALRKIKMKRANTIDIPKEQLAELNLNHNFSDSVQQNNYAHDKTVNDIRQNITSNVNNELDKNHLPEFQVKSSNDKKFMAFLNKNSDENHSSYVNPLKTALPVQKANWTNKFGNLKNSFEHNDAPQLPVSPKLSKKNSFTHAPTSPFKVVQSNKPPQVPNGVHHHQYNSHSVHNKVAAFQALDNKGQPPLANPKPQLRTHQSVPSYPTEDKTFSMYRDPNVHVKPNEWQQNKYASVDSYIQNNTVSPKISQTSYNPLYVPLNKQSPLSPTSPQSNQITPKPMITASPSDFPTYTYTSTDYTQPTCVSTFGPESVVSPIQNVTSPVIKNTSPVIKTTILPDTSYLKSKSPTKSMPPLLGSSRLSKQMKTVDLYSSNEYLSEPNTYYRSPQPFSPTYDYSYPMSNHDSRRSSGEFMATSQIMKYPQCQTATVVNKVTTRYEDEKQAANLRAFLTNNRNEKRKSEYSEKSSVSPLSEPNFSHVNETYVPPMDPGIRIKANNNFVSMENIGSTQFVTPEQGAPIRLRNNTSYYGSHNLLVSNQNEFIPPKTQQQFLSKFDSSKTIDKSKSIAAPVRLNSYGGQYIQPKVEQQLDFSKPTYGRKPTNDIQNNVVNNNITNLSRSNTTTHQRVANYEVKRKQSLPAQNSDFFESEFDQYQNAQSSSTYLPFGALKKSKSTHTLALLKQFEDKTKTEEVPLPSYIRRPTFEVPETKPIEMKPKSIIKKTPKIEDAIPMQSLPKLVQQPSKPIQSVSTPAPPIRSKSPPQIAPILRKSPPKLEPIVAKSTPQVRPRTPSPPPPPIRKTPPKSAVVRPPQKLQAPEITETPSSPLVEDGHIIYPGQTAETKRRVQHYAQTLNAMLNRKSIVMEDDEEEVSDKKESPKGGVQRSKSGTLLTVPKQYESAIKRSEVLEKERTVAAYFAGNKSPQGLQRSSSQHSVQSSTSVRTVEEQKSNTVSPMETNKDSKLTELRETSSRTTTTTTKSAHHLKILRNNFNQI